MKRILFALNVLIVSAALVGADNVVSPFVSRINAEVNGAEIVITWRDSEDLEGEVYRILRHTEAISTENYAAALDLALVAPGIESFTDKPQTGQDWWYAVLAVKAGESFDVFIPWRNTLGEAVVPDRSGEVDADSARILSLGAERKDVGILIHVECDRTERELTVFRSPKPFDDPAAIDHAVAVGRVFGQTAEIVDKPLPGVLWYYAAVDSRLFDTGNPRWMDYAGFARPVAVSLIDESVSVGGVLRPAPLPRLRISKSLNTGEIIEEIDGELPPRAFLDADAIRIIAGLLGPIEGELWVEPEPELLHVDRGYSYDRKQQILLSILEGSFMAGDWALAEAELFALSASNGVDESTKKRIQFYRGQSLYFLNRLPEAFLSFTVALDSYYVESRRWILRIYSDLTPVS